MQIDLLKHIKRDIICYPFAFNFKIQLISDQNNQIHEADSVCMFTTMSWTYYEKLGTNWQKVPSLVLIGKRDTGLEIVLRGFSTRNDPLTQVPQGCSQHQQAKGLPFLTKATAASVMEHMAPLFTASYTHSLDKDLRREWPVKPWQSTSMVSECPPLLVPTSFL